MKAPRDFVYVDELWEADAHWPQYFIDNKVWVYYDEYNAELPGDQDYCRIIVHFSNTEGLIYQRRRSDRAVLDAVLDAMQQPVSRQQLLELGFCQWQDNYEDLVCGQALSSGRHAELTLSH